MAPGISTDTLQGPLSNLHALSCGSSPHLHQLIRQIAANLDITPEPTEAYQNALEVVTAYPPVVRDVAATATARSVSQETIDKLAELRSEAITKILNFSVSTDTDFEVLVSYAKNWWEQVKTALEANFSKAEQLNFTRLGTVPNVVFPHTYNLHHAKILREFALQERRLLDIIARHTQ
jgi:hypothetical protein